VVIGGNMASLSKQASNTINNLVRLRSIKKNLNELKVSPKNTDYGISNHELIHIHGLIENAINRCILILNEVTE